MIDIVKREECTGCSACTQICPRECIILRADTEGFLYPEIKSEKCIHCDLCQSVCPVVNAKEHHLVLFTYGAYNMDEALRIRSSSGGLFIALCKYYLETLNGVVCGVRMSEDFKDVEYAIVDSVSDLADLQGSKYLQSYPIGVFKKVETYLKAGTHVLFSGTPCQVNGLKGFLRKEYDNLLSVDVICHGVPSPQLWKKYITEVEETHGAPLKQVSFRCKFQLWEKLGLSKKLQSGQASFSNRSTDSYLRIFLRNLILRPSCYNCKSKTYRLSDVTLGDFWGINDMAPGFNDDKGTSAVIVRTEKGSTAFEKIRKNLCVLEVTYEDVVRCNSSEYASASKPDQRDAFVKDIYNLSMDQLVKKYVELPLYKKAYRKFLRTIKGNRKLDTEYGIMFEFDETNDHEQT